MKILKFTRLQECACFNARKTSRMITQLFDQALKPAGIKATQFTILGVLANEGEMAIKELAGALGMDRTTLTRGIARLETEGLIKSREGDDARQRFVVLTTKGVQKLNNSIRYWEKAQGAMEKGLGENFPKFLDTLETALKSQQTIFRKI
jgi:DNA-binding MarR family transcriptional regulator